MKLAVAQIAPQLGDIDANLEKLRAFQQDALAGGAELVIFPELALSGYALGARTASCALSRSDPAFRRLLDFSRDLPLVTGFVERSPRGRIHNAAALLDAGEVVHVHRKIYLPTYSTWEEGKHFAKGKRLEVFSYRGFRVAIFICYDFWYPSAVYLAACDDADLFIVVASSSLDQEGMSPRTWELLIRSPAALYGGYVAFCNRVGTEAEASYWGGSAVIAPHARWEVRAGGGEELIYADIELNAVKEARDALPLLRDLDTDFTLRELTRVIDKRLIEND